MSAEYHLPPFVKTDPHSSRTISLRQLIELLVKILLRGCLNIKTLHSYGLGTRAGTDHPGTADREGSHRIKWP